MTFPDWLNWFNLSAFLLAGLFNLLGAWKKLTPRLQFHPFLRPQWNFWFWIWSLVQVILAGFICWVVLDLPSKKIPEQPGEIILTLSKAALIGSGFDAILNADEATDFLGSNFSPLYKNLIEPIIERIDATQPETDRFWAELRKYLAALPTSQIDHGMDLLKEKLTNDQNLKPERRQALLATVKQIQNLEISRPERCEKIVTLLKENIYRRNLPEMLNVLGCDREFLEAYVPKRARQLFLSKR
jgi:hypothetical protein